jgi:methylglutaconyl-CoA hydratase
MPDRSDALVLVEKTGRGTTLLSLNRPEKRNALNSPLIDALCGAIAEVEADLLQRVVIIRGEGPAFCSGLDLREAADPESAERLAQGVERMLRTIRGSTVVSIACVHGTAAAGGAGLASVCDLVVAANDARIGYPEVHRGLVPALVTTFLIRQVGERRARELVLLGELIDAPQALAIGFVNRVVPRAECLEHALAMAGKILQGAPGAVVRTKQALQELAGINNLDESLVRAREYHLTARSSAEAREGLAAFLEKRSPQWEQKRG